ncbi:MAG: helix-turn-helix domain-containing protein [Clostridia bacterium]|nr:helix-turn-helix domain-containing protein [Clostridia bacterium]
MNKRLKLLRKALKLTQKEFGSKIGLKPSSYSDIENGRLTPTDRNISLICREFNVSESWLRDGVGEMFVETNKRTIDSLCDEYSLDTVDRKILEKYIELSSAEKNVIKNYIFSLAKSLDEEMGEDNVNAQIEKEVDNYRKELEAEAKGKTLSAYQDTNAKKHA